MSERFEKVMFVAAEEARLQRVAAMELNETIRLRREVAELRAELEKRPSAEAVQAAEPVIRKLLSGLDEHWQTTAEGVAAIAAAEQLIAGLTGGEV